MRPRLQTRSREASAKMQGQSKERGEHWGLQHISKSSERRAGRANDAWMLLCTGGDDHVIDDGKAASSCPTIRPLFSSQRMPLSSEAFFYLILPHRIHRKSCFFVFGPPHALFHPVPSVLLPFLAVVFTTSRRKGYHVIVLERSVQTQNPPILNPPLFRALCRVSCHTIPRCALVCWKRSFFFFFFFKFGRLTVSEEVALPCLCLCLDETETATRESYYS